LSCLAAAQVKSVIFLLPSPLSEAVWKRILTGILHWALSPSEVLSGTTVDFRSLWFNTKSTHLIWTMCDNIVTFLLGK